MAELPRGVRGHAYTAIITICFVGGSWAFWWGSFYPSNTLDRTLFVDKQYSDAEQVPIDSKAGND